MIQSPSYTNTVYEVLFLATEPDGVLIGWLWFKRVCISPSASEGKVGGREEGREGEEPSLIPEFTEYHTGQERSKKESWFCDVSANPVSSGTVPGMLRDALRFATFTSLTLPHSYPQTYNIYTRDIHSTECPSYSSWLVEWSKSARKAECYLKFHMW